MISVNYLVPVKTRKKWFFSEVGELLFSLVNTSNPVRQPVLPERYHAPSAALLPGLLPVLPERHHSPSAASPAAWQPVLPERHHYPSAASPAACITWTPSFPLCRPAAWPAACICPGFSCVSCLHVTNYDCTTVKTFLILSYLSCALVADPYHFDTDPDPAKKD